MPQPKVTSFADVLIELEADIEAIGQAFKSKLLDAVSDKATMLLGTFDPGK